MFVPIDPPGANPDHTPCRSARPVTFIAELARVTLGAPVCRANSHLMRHLRFDLHGSFSSEINPPRAPCTHFPKQRVSQDSLARDPAHPSSAERKSPGRISSVNLLKHPPAASACLLPRGVRLTRDLDYL